MRRMSSSLLALLQKRQQQRIILLIIVVAATTFLLIPDEATRSSFTMMSSRKLDLLASPLASEAQAHSSNNITTYTDLIRDNAPLPKYSLQKAIKAADMYSSRFALLRYAPATDIFTGYYSKKHVIGLVDAERWFRQ